MPASLNRVALAMDWLLSLKLIRLFDFYLALAFVVSIVLRIRQYRAILGVVGNVPGRWPKLFQLVRQHRHIFLTWGTILPLLLTLGLWLLHTILRRNVLSDDDDLTVRELGTLWPAIPFIALSGVVMLVFDVVGTADVVEIDRRELEKYFDQAEFWLRSWTAPVVNVFTLGYVNPRKMVHAEVRTALIGASQMLNDNLWWLTMQALLRTLFGLSLWITYLVAFATT